MIFENLHINNLTPLQRYKRIVKDDNIYTLFRTHEWNIVNIVHLRKIQVALKSRLIWKCAKTAFLKVKVDFKVDLNSRLFSKCVRTVLRNQGWFQLCMIWGKNFSVLLQILFLWGISWWWKVKTTFSSLIFWKNSAVYEFLGAVDISF